MSYHKYNHYKILDIPWIDSIPEHWAIKRTKFIVSYIGSGKTPRGGAEIYTDEGVMILRSQNIYNDGLRLKDVAYVDPEIEQEQINTRVKTGDVLLNITGASIGRSAIVPLEFPIANINQHVCIFRPIKKHVDPVFLHFLLCSNLGQEQILSNENGTSREGLNFRQAGNLMFPIPPKEEQRSIVSFLDKKTAEIDVLITKKQKLLQLLEEKYRALITQAVTKGLNPKVTMKDSGVNWMGHIPEHWRIIPFKYVIYFQEGPGIMAVDFTEQGVPLIRIRNLTANKVQLEGCNYLNPEKVEKIWKQFQLDVDDLLISTSATTGLVSSVGPEAKGAIPYTGIIRLKPKNKSIINEYIKLLVSSTLFFTQIDLLKTGSTIQHFGPLHLGQMSICLPPLGEQSEIARLINLKTAKINRIKLKIEKAIELLKEYRSALITDVVTGKIDIRNYSEKMVNA
ncbi:TPA: restriction endonuclease subunit S [Legionella pneumophila]|uniref:restriction endonuclease subunit S n=1 Tax=Legionella pneumophila TaxID=446 RepID=UPI00102223FD|nr:restriction endonuclease subunit S [Legionella pneumophila]RYX03435.1 restriction endonuclease subunit S [Legionella pneumophila]HCE5420931.1 restriction endonuclease subunit S [Legionella pneumophila]HCE5625202.1 restriction endonuclease subunit S [Legionella pneumophila]